jgi:sulfur-oxidizing protein SoxX
MKNKSKIIFSLLGGMLLTGGFLSSAVFADSGKNISASRIEEGKKLAFSRPKGNCLACHMIKDGVSPGNIAPPLISMKMRFPDRKKLRDQIWDASKRNAETAMPLFGVHEILSEAELEKVVDFIHSL